MHTIFAIAPSRECLESLLDSLEANSVALGNVKVTLPERGERTVPVGVAEAEPTEDSFSGNRRKALTGGAIGAVVGMILLSVSGYPGFFAAGAGTSALGIAIVGAAGFMIGTMLGLEIPESISGHYEARLKRGDRLVALRVPSSQLHEFTGLFTQEGMEDIAVAIEKPASHGVGATAAS